MKKTTLAFLLFIPLAVLQTVTAQVGIGTQTPNGALDISATQKGLIYPSVALSRTDQQTIVNPKAAVTLAAAGTTVFNTATTSFGDFSVYPGVYTWDGVANWLPQFDLRDYKIFEQDAGLRTTSDDLLNILTAGYQEISFDDNTFIPEFNGKYKVSITAHYGAGKLDQPSGSQFVNFASAGGDFQFEFNSNTTNFNIDTYSGINNDTTINGGSNVEFTNEYNQTTVTLVETLIRNTSYNFILSFNQAEAIGFEADGDENIIFGLDGRGLIALNGIVRCAVEIEYIGQ